jgi:hypothetical protein
MTQGSFSNALYPLIGLHLHKQPVLPRIADKVGFDVFDLHGSLSNSQVAHTIRGVYPVLQNGAYAKTNV